MHRNTSFDDIYRQYKTCMEYCAPENGVNIRQSSHNYKISHFVQAMQQSETRKCSVGLNSENHILFSCSCAYLYE